MQESIPSPSPETLRKHACAFCARRKIKCDKIEPCGNCRKARIECSYETPLPPKPRKRAADDDLLARIAVYEDLMRKHNVDFAQHANTWVLYESAGIIKQAESASPASIFPATGVSKSKPVLSDTDTAPALERCSWSNLCQELKYPPIQSLHHKGDPVLCPPPSIATLFSKPHPALHELHPEPKHIYRFWQIFVEDVNPLSKVVHVPTLQQRIMEATWNPSSISKSLTALLFAIYTLAITSISAEDCQSSFGDTKHALLIRYRAAALQALMAADVFVTRDLETLQALFLFILADSESALVSTLSAAAIRLGQRMGLNRESIDPKMRFFEKEMRIRLWWQIYTLDSRFRLDPAASASHLAAGFGNIRLPLNINDADLHPGMTEAPIEHSGPTEMICVLMRLEAFEWIRVSPTADKVFINILRAPIKGGLSTELEDEAIKELEARYHAKYFRNADETIPLHRLAQNMAGLAVARMRFKVHHPRGKASVSDGDVYMTRQEGDILFETALSSLEMLDEGLRSQFSSHLFTHMAAKVQFDIYIYIISDLRWRRSGDRVVLAWRFIEDFYTENPELIDEADNTFYAGFGDLTLEAWEAYMMEAGRGRGTREPETPRFILQLREKRETGADEVAHELVGFGSHGLEGLGFSDENHVSWDYWSDFLRL